MSDTSEKNFRKKQKTTWNTEFLDKIKCLIANNHELKLDDIRKEAGYKWNLNSFRQGLYQAGISMGRIRGMSLKKEASEEQTFYKDHLTLMGSTDNVRKQNNKFKKLLILAEKKATANIALLKNLKTTLRDDLEKTFKNSNLKFEPHYDVSKKPHSQEILNLVISDAHCDENINLQSTNGVEEYNFTEFLVRLQNLVDATIDYQVNKYNSEELHIYLLGDMLQGFIHMDPTVYKHPETYVGGNVKRLALALFQAIAELKVFFPKLHVHCIAGNHGRLGDGIDSRKDFEDNYDTTCYELLSLMLKNYKDRFSSKKGFGDLEFEQEGASWYKIANINNYRVLYTHGDSVNVKNINGNLISKLMESIRYSNNPNDDFDIAICGHFHNFDLKTMGNKRMIINGSFPKTDGYAMKNFNAFSKAEQTLFAIHPKHGVNGIHTIDLCYAHTKKKRYRYEDMGQNLFYRLESKIQEVVQITNALSKI